MVMHGTCFSGKSTLLESFLHGQPIENTARSNVRTQGVHENAGMKIIELEEPKCRVVMKICDLHGYCIRTQHPTTAAVMLVYNVTAKASVALMKNIYEKLFLTSDISMVIVASKMDLSEPKKHEVNFRHGFTFAEERKIYSSLSNQHTSARNCV